jgi:DNA alkylation damage repair protein AlkB
MTDTPGVRWLAPGACLLEGFVALDAQAALAARCRELVDADTGAYVPIVRGGKSMRVRMLCLGRHWNPRIYAYQDVRGDFDNEPVPPLPADLADVGRRAAAAAGFAFAPDICLINWYGDEGRMGLHQDKDESRASIDAGHPVVSLSLGETARFLFGGTRRRDAVEPLLLKSGDAFVFGGPARLRYHGISRILPGTAPTSVAGLGRFNLTFRQY